MKAVHPYLNFDGNAEEAFGFYRTVFGGEFTNVTRYRDFGDDTPEEAREKIANIGLPLGNGVVLMASDVVQGMSPPLRRGNDTYITLEPDTLGDSERIFTALSDGGEVEMPLQQTPWAERYGSCTDRYGVCWMVNYQGSVQFP